MLSEMCRPIGLVLGLLSWEGEGSAEVGGVLLFGGAVRSVGRSGAFDRWVPIERVVGVGRDGLRLNGRGRRLVREGGDGRGRRATLGGGTVWWGGGYRKPLGPLLVTVWQRGSAKGVER